MSCRLFAFSLMLALTFPCESNSELSMSCSHLSIRRSIHYIPVPVSTHVPMFRGEGDGQVVRLDRRQTRVLLLPQALEGKGSASFILFGHKTAGHWAINSSRKCMREQFTVRTFSVKGNKSEAKITRSLIRTPSSCSENSVCGATGFDRHSLIALLIIAVVLLLMFLHALVDWPLSSHWLHLIHCLWWCMPRDQWCHGLSSDTTWEGEHIA